MAALELQRSDERPFLCRRRINGTQVHMLIDTGATGIALSRDDARTAGIATSIGMNDVVGEGADGTVHGEYVTIDRMSLGRSAPPSTSSAIVLNSGGQSLLGQSSSPIRVGRDPRQHDDASLGCSVSGHQRLRWPCRDARRAHRRSSYNCAAVVAISLKSARPCVCG